MSAQHDHPVWELYDFHRTVRLNWKYYRHRLRRTRKLNNLLEILLAVTAPGSAIAGYAAWQEGLGYWIWMILGTIAALFSLAKPVLKLGHQLERLEKAAQAYAGLDGDCQELTSEIRHQRTYDDQHYDQFLRLMKKRNDFKQTMADEAENRKLISRLQDEVAEELPTDSFFVPGDDDAKG